MRAGVLNAETLLARSTKTRVINGRTTKAGVTKSGSYKKRELQNAGATKSGSFKKRELPKVQATKAGFTIVRATKSVSFKSESDQSGIYDSAGYKKRELQKCKRPKRDLQ